MAVRDGTILGGVAGGDPDPWASRGRRSDGSTLHRMIQFHVTPMEPLAPSPRRPPRRPSAGPARASVLATVAALLFGMTVVAQRARTRRRPGAERRRSPIRHRRTAAAGLPRRTSPAPGPRKPVSGCAQSSSGPAVTPCRPCCSTWPSATDPQEAWRCSSTSTRRSSLRLPGDRRAHRGGHGPGATRPAPPPVRGPRVRRCGRGGDRRPGRC